MDRAISIMFAACNIVQEIQQTALHIMQHGRRCLDMCRKLQLLLGGQQAGAMSCVSCRSRFCQERGEALPPLPPPAGALPALAQGASEDARGGVAAGDLPTLEELRAAVTAHALQDLPAEVGFLDNLVADGSVLPHLRLSSTPRSRACSGKQVPLQFPL
jgi:hypothetical protein